MSVKSVFISHSSKDDGIVREIRQSLEALRIETWTDSERLSGGDLLKPDIQASIEKVDHFLVVLSQNSLNSDWVLREIRHAQTVNKDGYKIIPLTLPGIGTTILKLLFPEEPVAIQLGDGIAAIPNALPHILAAIGVKAPTEIIRNLQAQATPVADLVLELRNPAIDEFEGKRRAAADATLTYQPPDSSLSIEGLQFRFIAPLGPIEAEEIAWYLERYINWPSGLFEERAKRVIAGLPKWGLAIYETLRGDEAREALEAWRSTDARERRFTVKLYRAPNSAADNAEAATLLLSLPWELIHDGEDFLFQNKGVRVRRSLPNRMRRPRWQPSLRFECCL